MKFWILAALSLFPFCFSQAFALTGCEGLVEYFGEYEANHICIYLKDKVQHRELMLSNQIGKIFGKISMKFSDQTEAIDFGAYIAFDPSMNLDTSTGNSAPLLSNGANFYNNRSDLGYEFFELRKQSKDSYSVYFDAHNSDFSSRDPHQIILTKEEIENLTRMDGKAALTVSRQITAKNNSTGAVESALLTFNLTQKSLDPVESETCDQAGNCQVKIEVGRVNHPCLHGHPYKSATFDLNISKDWKTYSINGFVLNKCQ